MVLTPSSVLDDDEVPTAGVWRGCLQGHSVPLMDKRGESRLPAAGGSGDDRGSRLLCPVYTRAGGCETARRKREVHTSYLPHFALNVKILKVWATTREPAVKNVATDRGEDSLVRWADCACLLSEGDCDGGCRLGSTLNNRGACSPGGDSGWQVRDDWQV